MSSNIKIQIKEAKNFMILKNEDIINFIPRTILTGNSIKMNLKYSNSPFLKYLQLYHLLKLKNNYSIADENLNSYKKELINELIGDSFVCENQDVQHSEVTKYFDENNESLKSVSIRGE